MREKVKPNIIYYTGEKSNHIYLLDSENLNVFPHYSSSQAVASLRTNIRLGLDSLPLQLQHLRRLNDSCWSLCWSRKVKFSMLVQSSASLHAGPDKICGAFRSRCPHQIRQIVQEMEKA